MSSFQGARFWMAPVFLLVAPDESPTRRRACIVVGRELRKIADDFEASFEAAKLEKLDGRQEQNIVAEAIKTVCVVAGMVFIGRAVWTLITN